MTNIAMTALPAALSSFVAYEDSNASAGQNVKDVTIASGAGVLSKGTILGKVTATGEYKQHTVEEGVVDGTQVADAILKEDVDATSASVSATVYRYGTMGFKRVGLTYASGATADQKLEAEAVFEARQMRFL